MLWKQSISSTLELGEVFWKKVAFEFEEWVGLCKVEWKEMSLPERLEHHK